MKKFCREVKGVRPSVESSGHNRGEIEGIMRFECTSGQEVQEVDIVSVYTIIKKLG